MTNNTSKIEVHWNYLLAIENDLEKLSRYVEFDERNFDCFSVEIARILLSASAEADVVCKQLCLKVKPSSSADNIHTYRDEIKTAYPNIVDFDVILSRYGLSLKPWNEWKDIQGVPDWWTAYNKLKHHRETEYHRANLKNAIYSVAGLFVMVLYFYQEKANLGELMPAPQILRVSADHFGGIYHGGNDLSFVYRI
ncbi:MAG: hypothetical protein HQ552_09405 [Desulfobacteraceae bacterium]|nr:hypothetical protein [Desulfobacteraceae bacterium]